MKKILFGLLLLTSVLMVSLEQPAFAAGTFANFTKMHDYYDQFEDVGGQWFAPYVTRGYELGLIKGTSSSHFSPDVSVTLAETITLASRIHSIFYRGTDIEAAASAGGQWYDSYVDYALNNGIIEHTYTDYNLPATRCEVAVIFAKSLPDDALSDVRMVEDGAVPDVKMTAAYASSVYKLYRSGILSGSDEKGTFNPESHIRRSEIAAIMLRLADPTQRVTTALAAHTTDSNPSQSPDVVSEQDMAALPTQRTPSGQSHLGSNASAYEQAQIDELPEFEEEVNSILSCIEPSMSDVEKTLAVHDYFVQNYSYGFTLDTVTGGILGESYTAYGIMVNKKGVCAAYADAYKYIMDKLGIPCIKVISTPMDHAWNMVSIDGDWYHVDVTYDDTGSQYLRHDSFLRSDEGIAGTGHYGWDKGLPIAGTKFDNAFWISATSDIYYTAGNWYYFDAGTIDTRFQDGFIIINESDLPDNGYIKRYNFATNTSETIFTISPNTYTYQIRGRAYQRKWKGSSASIAAYNGKIYYNTNNSIYSINPDGTGKELVCTVTLSDAPLSSTTGFAYIKRIEIKNGTIYYVNSEDSETYVATVLPGAEATWTITSSAGTGGRISPAGSIELLQGRSRTFVIRASEGSVISDVKIDGISIGPVSTYTFSNVTGNHSIQATFVMSSDSWQVIPVDADYDFIYRFSEGMAVVEKDRKYGYINASGKLIIPLTGEYDSVSGFRGGLATVRKNGKEGLINTSGKLIVPCIYDVIAPFTEDGMATVVKDGKFGFMNTSGELVVPCIYDNSREYMNGIAWVVKDDGFFIDKSGKEVPTPENEADYFKSSSEYSIVYKGEKCGFIDSSGKLVVPCEYDNLGQFSEGLAYAELNGKKGYVNTKGKLVIPCIYLIAGDFSDGLAYVCDESGKYGYIDMTGKLIVPFLYDEAVDFREGLAPVKMDGHWALLKMSSIK